MNKYTAAGLLAAALEGKRIIVISHDQREVREALNEFEPFTSERVQIRRANGAESVRCISGGVIRLQSRRASLRGMSADVVLLEADVKLDRDLAHDLRAVTATGAVGEVIRA